MNRGPKILIAEDDADTLQAYSLLLRSEGYDVLGSSSARECLRLAREERPDLILLDVRLPDLSGTEVCRQIKADPELAGTFVIHVSGVEVSPDSQAEGLESGADGYLTKPIQYRKLTAQIRALLRIREDVDSIIEGQQEREFASLERLSSRQGPSVAAQMFGVLPVRKGFPEIFEGLVKLYGELLDLALEQRAYKVERNIPEYLNAIVDQLGFLRAGPRDVVEIHSAALKRKAAGANLTKSQAYVEEGRMRLVELMGYLVSYYRSQSLGVTGPPESRPNSPSAKEQTDE